MLRTGSNRGSGWLKKHRMWNACLARLHEYQGKRLLAESGVLVPEGHLARTPDEAAELVEKLGGRAIVKIQAWVTGRKALGGVLIVNGPEEAREAAERMLSMTFGNFPVEELLVEGLVDIRDELFVSLSIDDTGRCPVLLLDTEGGSGIEDRAETVARILIDPRSGIDAESVRQVIAESSIDASFHDQLVDAIVRIVDLARTIEARSLEVNPLVTTGDGRVVAADCRVTIDDYAVFRHPELGIEIARELDHPATDLERIAYDVENADHRGTFYFAKLPTDGSESSKGLIGFHGAGGGGSMMSMDAASSEGFTLANFCDTSGNPSAAKVYRAARIILAQPGIIGYFGSGSGVASQEQFHSAYGLAKAFNEVNVSVPVVVRLGGNSEERACEILTDACDKLPGVVEGYGKDDTPAACASRFATLVSEAGDIAPDHHRFIPSFVGEDASASFPIDGGRVWIDLANCDDIASQLVIEHGGGLFERDEQGHPRLAITEDEAAKKDSEFVACEVECLRAGRPVIFVDLEIPGLDELLLAAGEVD